MSEIGDLDLLNREWHPGFVQRTSEIRGKKSQDCDPLFGGVMGDSPHPYRQPMVERGPRTNQFVTPHGSGADLFASLAISTTTIDWKRHSR